MTVDELGDRMTSDEYVRWQAFWAYRAAMQQKAEKEAAVKAKVSRGR